MWGLARRSVTPLSCKRTAALRLVSQSSEVPFTFHSLCFFSKRNITLTSVLNNSHSTAEVTNPLPESATPHTNERFDFLKESTVENVLKGSTQAYISLGLLLDELFNAIPVREGRQPTPGGPGMIAATSPNSFSNQLSSSLMVCQALQRAFPEVDFPKKVDEEVIAEDPVPSANAWARLDGGAVPKPKATPASDLMAKAKEEVNKAVKSLQKVYPMTENLASQIVTAFTAQRCKEDNLLRTAAPKDHVMQSSVVSRGIFENGNYVDRLSSSLEVSFSPERLVNSTSQTPLFAENCENQEEKKTGKTKKSIVDVLLENCVINGAVPFRDAQAYVLVKHSVVVPPSRYLNSYSWFYSRVTDYSCENDHIFGAKNAATLADSIVCRFIDFIARMFTGKQWEIKLLPQVRKKLKMPENPEKLVPVVEKYLLFFLVNEKWVLDHVETDLTLSSMPGPQL